MDDPVRIRPVRPPDAPELARLLEEFNGPPVDEAAARRRLRAARGIEHVLVAEPAGTPRGLAGFVSVRMVPWLSSDRPYAEVTELFVRPRWRRRGIGRALLRAAEELARQRGAEEVLVLTGLRNHAAQALYRAAGFRDYALALRKRLEPGKAAGTSGDG